MAKAKSKAATLIPDQSGGMIPVIDHRFEGDWSIRFKVPTVEAANWLQYLSAECGRRQWQLSGIGQIEATENSGSISIAAGTAGGDHYDFTLVWERKRGRPLLVTAKAAGDDQMALLEELLQAVWTASVNRTTSRHRVFGELYYQGLPWKGELWLSDSVRLGPPSVLDEQALFGPRVVLVDEVVEAIDRHDAAWTFRTRLRELSVFLSVALRRDMQALLDADRAWTFQLEESGTVTQYVAQVGYFEPNRPTDMPPRGAIPPVPIQVTTRPDFGRVGISDETEQSVPEDIIALWDAFTGLPEQRRRRFLQAGSLWQAACSTRRDFETTRYAQMVAACEALKPAGKTHTDSNAYDVVEAVLGKSVADEFRATKPQDVRNANLHGGEFRGSEFARVLFLQTDRDPTFDESNRFLWQVASATLVGWLARKGDVTLAPPTGRRGSPN